MGRTTLTVPLAHGLTFTRALRPGGATVTVADAEGRVILREELGVRPRLRANAEPADPEPAR